MERTAAAETREAGKRRLWVDLKAWQVAIHIVASVLSLLLLVLLENSSGGPRKSRRKSSTSWPRHRLR